MRVSSVGKITIIKVNDAGSVTSEIKEPFENKKDRERVADERSDKWIGKCLDGDVGINRNSNSISVD